MASTGSGGGAEDWPGASHARTSASQPMARKSSSSACSALTSLIPDRRSATSASSRWSSGSSLHASVARASKTLGREAAMRSLQAGSAMLLGHADRGDLDEFGHRFGPRDVGAVRHLHALDDGVDLELAERAI